VIINDAITSVYRVIAVWMPTTVVPRSFATVAIDTFMTDESRTITNCAAARVTSTAFAAPVPECVVSVMGSARARGAARSVGRTRSLQGPG